MSELDRLPAGAVFAYAAACLEHRALDLAAWVEVAFVAIEALYGGNTLRKRMERHVRDMLAADSPPTVSNTEQAAVAAIEREISQAFPFYLDDERLNAMHQRFGAMRLCFGSA